MCHLCLVKRAGIAGMKLSPIVTAFWGRFAATGSVELHNKLLGTEYFGDNEKDANELAQLVLAGSKKATAPLLWSYQFDRQPVPQPGSLTVVVNWNGEPQCVVQTARVDIAAYGDVSAEFAAIEGEGDGSLRYWREVHWPYYQRECARIGKTAAQEMPVICHQFSTVFP